MDSRRISLGFGWLPFTPVVYCRLTDILVDLYAPSSLNAKNTAYALHQALQVAILAN